MGESKSSIYDFGDATTAANPPLVPAANVVPLAMSTVDAPTFASVDPLQDPANATINSNGDDVPDVPMMPTEGEYCDYIQARRAGAGIASGVVGLLVGGPIVAAILGFGAAYAADQEGATGDAARAVGDLALQARDRAKEIGQKHDVASKTQAKAAEVWEKAQEADRRHRILERSKNVAVSSFCWTVDFVKRHRLIERGVNCVGKTLYCLIQKIVHKIEGARDREEQGYPQPLGHQRVPTEEPWSQTATQKVSSY